MRPQEKVRRMRPGGTPRRPGRSTDGTRQNYYSPDVITVSPPAGTDPELVLVTDEDGNLTDAYIAYIEQNPYPEDTP
jgi:hypothetical protein